MDTTRVCRSKSSVGASVVFRRALRCRRWKSRYRPGRHRFKLDDKERKRFGIAIDRKSTRLNSSHLGISYAVFCLNDTATTEIYPLSLHDALPICRRWKSRYRPGRHRFKLDDKERKRFGIA